MPELREYDAGSIVVERAADDGTRRIHGYAYRWGERSVGGTPEAGGLPEGFEQDAFTAAVAERAGRAHAFMDTHYSKGGRTVGAIKWSTDDVGLRYDGELLKTPRAQEYAAELDAMGGEGSVSMEAIIDVSQSRREKGAVIHRSARPVALAGVPYGRGAYEGATVAIREVQKVEAITPEVTERAGEVEVTAGPVPMTREETIAVAERAATEIARTFAERTTAGPPAQPFAEFKNLGELIQAAYNDKAPRNHVAMIIDIAERALSDIVTTGGVNAALLTGNLTVRNVAGIVSRGRPAITAFGGPAPIQDVGLSVTWPYFDGTLTDHVAAQSAQKAEIESAAVDIKLGTEALVTYAGGADIAYQLIRQGDPSILDIYGRILLTAWGVVTDAAFVTELESGSVTQDLTEAVTAVDFAELVAHVITGSLAVETATGQPAEFILAGSTAFLQFAKVVAASSTTIATTGSFDLASLGLGIGGVRLIHVPSLTAGKAIISNRLAARWHEAGPFLATAEDVAKLGRNFAYWSMGAGARYIPAGIIELYDVTP